MLELARVSSDLLESVPQDDIAARRLVDREVRLEHAPISAKQLDDMSDRPSPHLDEIITGRWEVPALKPHPVDHHAHTTKLHDNVVAPGEIRHIRSPPGKDLVPSPLIRPDTERATQMVEYEC